MSAIPNTDELKEGYIKVQLDYAPKTNGKKFKAWCDKYGFAYLGVGRRAWCSSLGTYLRDASGIAFSDGEMFLFYEEDLVDIIAHQNKTIKAISYHFALPIKDLAKAVRDGVPEEDV